MQDNRCSLTCVATGGPVCVCMCVLGEPHCVCCMNLKKAQLPLVFLLFVTFLGCQLSTAAVGFAGQRLESWRHESFGISPAHVIGVLSGSHGI